MIKELLVDKTLSEKADIKSEEVVNVSEVGQFSKGNLSVEILSISKLDGGVEVLAKATQDGSPVGFGDGTVEIERFKIYNPPILVEDPNGDIVQEWTDKITGKHTRTFREDPQAALQQVLTDIIKVVAKDGSKIVDGKVGNTTTTVFAGTADAILYLVNGGTDQAAWDTAHDGASGTADTAEVTGNVVAATDTVNFQRLIAGFDTSTIPDTDVISSATVSWYATASATITNTSTTDLRILFATPTSTTSYDGGDYDQIGDINNPTVQAPSKNLADIDSEGYKDFALNATGIANINVTGTTVFGLRIGIDCTDSYPGTSHNNTYQVYMADQTGTTNDPKIVVEHAAAAAASKNLALLGVG